MKLGEPNTRGAIAAALSMIVFGLLAAFAGDEFSDEDQEKALALVGQLEADSFAKREAAANALGNLPATALPWLEELVEATGPTDVELRGRLKKIIMALKKRESELTLRNGTQVKIDLKAAKPSAVLEALKDQVGSSLTGARASSIWAKEQAKDFSFEGSFWEAVDTLLEVYPPKTGGRENLGNEYRIGRWGEQDFKAAQNSSVSNGILRVRHGRMALENTGGKDYLVVTLVPAVEPTYQIEEVALLVKGLALDDGTMIEPEKKICEWKAQYSSSRYNPGSVFTWIFPAEEGHGDARDGRDRRHRKDQGAAAQLGGGRPPRRTQRPGQHDLECQTQRPGTRGRALEDPVRGQGQRAGVLR